jgi:hypothetical protein
MSLFGAMRLVCEGWRPPRAGDPDEPLRAIRSGAWAAWAREGATGPLDDRTTAAAREGRVVRPGRAVTALDGRR